MYKSDNFKQLDNETFALKINTDRDYKILQLTDLPQLSCCLSCFP